jgi:hypothetical protein
MIRYKITYGDYTGMSTAGINLSEEEADKLYKEVCMEVDNYTLVEKVPYEVEFKFGK